VFRQHARRGERAAALEDDLIFDFGKKRTGTELEVVEVILPQFGGRIFYFQ
jgi:hypothetical protein